MTSEYKCSDDEYSVQRGENLTRLWTDLPDGMQERLDDFPEVQELLDGFGPLLSPTVKKTGQVTREERLQWCHLEPCCVSPEE